MAARLLQQNWGTIVRQSLSQSTHLRLLSATPCLQRIDASKWGELPIVHVKATDNNTMCTVSDSHGTVLCWASAGSVGFKNARRGTTFAAESAGAATAEKAQKLGIQKVRVQVKGIGKGRQASIKGMEDGGLDIVSITDVTPVPHNGCRPRKARRL